jgi:Xaa-Pro aminopeptidase
VSFGLWQHLSDALEGVVTLQPAPPLVDALRMVKDEDEIRALRASIALNDQAFAHLARTVRPGCTEQELAWEMENFVRTHGGEDISFPPITVGGPNSAIPHATPSARAVEADELVLFDIGAKLGGYCSDMTRTVCIETVPDRLREAWHVVHDALLEAEARVRPGMTGTEVDGIARNLIGAAGLGEQFTHGLGHGIGLEIHEPPWITQSRGTDVLRPGMVFSIEPGVYLPGLGGVRLEDLVLLTERGAEVLCGSPKKLFLSEVLGDLNR